VKRITSTGSPLPDDVELQIWETGGWERFRRGLPAALTRGATVWYLCFEHRPTLDLTDGDSITAHCQDALNQLEPWFQYLSAASAVFPAPVLPILIGLKADLLERSPLAKVGQTWKGTTKPIDGLEAFNSQLCGMATKAICSSTHISGLLNPLQCFHVSSKTNEGIDELLHYSADTMRAIFHRFPRGVPSVDFPPTGLRPGAVRLPLPRDIPPSQEPGKCFS
jgi:GTPase SAR1 family protein